MNHEKLFRSTGSYIAGTGLIESVNVAVALEKPLLIKGEPGFRYDTVKKFNDFLI